MKIRNPARKKPYRQKRSRSKAFDGTCRNNGTCPACRDNRTYAVRKAMAGANLDDWTSL